MDVDLNLCHGDCGIWDIVVTLDNIDDKSWEVGGYSHSTHWARPTQRGAFLKAMRWLDGQYNLVTEVLMP